MYKKYSLLLLFPVLLFFSLNQAHATAETSQIIHVTEEQPFSHSEYLKVPDTDVLVWRIQNTSTTDELTYSILQRQTGTKCGTGITIETNTLPPGKKVCGLLLGQEYIDQNEFLVTLSGTSGTAILCVL